MEVVVPADDTVFRTEGLTHENALAVHIIDEGIGIPENRLEQIFQAFEQVVSYARQEAQQRLREQAERQGFEEVINLRIETSIMSSRQQQRSSSVEILAFGTGIVYGSESSPE